MIISIILLAIPVVYNQSESSLDSGQPTSDEFIRYSRFIRLPHVTIRKSLHLRVY